MGIIKGIIATLNNVNLLVISLVKRALAKNKACTESQCYMKMDKISNKGGVFVTYLSVGNFL